MAQESIEPEHRRAAACFARQGSRGRASLPPLSIGRRSLQEWPKAASDDMDVSVWPTPATTPGRRRAKVGPDVKLDLTSLPRAPLEPSDIELRRDKFAFYDKECSRVANYHIYLGSDAVAKNKETLKAHGITHVLNCVGFVCPEYFKNDFFYKTLWLQDSPGEDITSLLYDVFDYFEEVGELGGRVFVHCCQGVSRSTSLVIAYMMWRENRSFEEAFQDVKASRGVTNPNMGFACQLLQCQKRVHAAPMSPTSVLRMYRIAPYSPYDPLHLVPKAVMNPAAGALDSRGAFVIHVPIAIFVWIGRSCDAKMAQAARVAAAQVVRYERAQGSVHIIAEGTETDEFWDSLGKYADLLDDVDSHELHQNRCEVVRQRKKERAQALLERAKNSGAGNRILASYDDDFQLYHRVRQGGVVPPVGAGMVGVPTRIPEREDGWSVLRRKFLSGELVPAREKETDTSDSSPSSSRAVSSPLFSPFSSTTTSSGSDSVSASPLSHLSILSPATPSYDLRESSEASVSHLSTSQCCSLQDMDNQREESPHIRPSFTDDVKIVSNNSAENKVTGERPDGLGEICLETKDIDTEMTDVSSERSAHVLLQESEASQMQPCVLKVSVVKNDSSSFSGRAREPALQGAWDSILEAGQIVLYAWPQLDRDVMVDAGGPVISAWPQPERLDDFTADHFTTDKNVFVLVVPQKASNGDMPVVYVWIGKELHDQVSNVGPPSEKIGQQFLRHLNCRTGAEIRVVKQGFEPEEFLAYFVR